MKIRVSRRTQAVCTTVVILACVWDVVVLPIWGDPASISQFFHWYKNDPVVTFALGYLFCHFFGVIEDGPTAPQPKPTVYRMTPIP